MASSYTVTSVTEDQINDAALNLIDVYDINFTIEDRPGSFQVQVNQLGDVVKAAHDAITAKVDEIDAIYAF